MLKILPGRKMKASLNTSFFYFFVQSTILLECKTVKLFHKELMIDDKIFKHNIK